jgi:hypothetical protein
MKKHVVVEIFKLCSTLTKQVTKLNLTEPSRNLEETTTSRPVLKAGKEFDGHNPISK